MPIRKAKVQDVERVVRLFEQLGYQAEPAQVASQLGGVEQNTPSQAFVAEEAATVVGVAVVHVLTPLHVDSAWALLSALIVDETHRSTGIGQDLLAVAEQFAIERGCSQLELSSSVTRSQAHKFYERNGYQEKRIRFVKIFT